jgi:hypothetical protein
MIIAFAHFQGGLNKRKNIICTPTVVWTRAWQCWQTTCQVGRGEDSTILLHIAHAYTQGEKTLAVTNLRSMFQINTED